MSTETLAQESTIANWRQTPFSRWAFHHVPDLIPTQPISRNETHSEPLPLRSADLSAFELTLANGGTIDIAGFEDATSTDAMVALVHGEIVYESYRHAMTSRSQHILMSASKAITGLIIGILNERGQLMTETKVIEYVPEVANTVYADATIRQLLDMRCSVTLSEEQERAYSDSTHWDPLSRPGAGTDFLDFVKSLPPAPQRQDGPFKYVSVNTDLLGVAIERATGMRFSQVASETLWTPLGAEDDAFITLMRGGTPRCTGGLGMTARDFARVGQMMLNHGRAGSAQVVPKDWIEDILSNGSTQAWAQGDFAAGFAPFGAMSYRSGWYIIERDPKTLFAMGIHGQNLFVDPERDFVLAKFSSQAAPVEHIALTHRGVAEIRRCLVGR